MGRTIPPFRPALEHEIQSWKDYRRGLNPEERPLMDKIMLEARKRSDAGSLAARPLISEVLFLSILIGQQKEIEKLKARLEKIENIDQKSQIAGKTGKRKNLSHYFQKLNFS
ncbi:MAG: hypothetical protein K9W44_17680 [Candidatus Lokiarchaeota archaeon]|nr:hypothetical protein [Candidatus Harpocratesius repetitus]